ncbi:glycosyltransferase [Clostridium sp.]|uniref:glycosyltransferase family 4 protein n=1 Tax=Clostridium sp. TaxID=1506 RepID=UPI003216AA0D
MKVLLCARGDYTNLSGGDTAIMFKIYSFLKEQKVEVTICGANEEVKYEDYDIVHLFDIKNIFDAYKHFKLASNSRCNIVISPMYFNMSKFFNYTNNEERFNLWNNCKVYRERILKKSNLIFCNSNYEKDIIVKDFNPKGEIIVVNNGVAINYDEVPLYNFKERYELDNYILCVGRICESKNQLTLSKICNEIGIDLVLVGTTLEGDYLKKCLKYDTTHYMGFMNDYDLYNAYTFSSAHVLASFSEVTSLSSLTAAAYGCNIVVTEEGASKEYFKDMAIYCNPYDYDSIKNAVRKSINKKKSNKLKDYIRENYNLDNVIMQIYNGYKSKMNP